MFKVIPMDASSGDQFGLGSPVLSHDANDRDTIGGNPKTAGSSRDLYGRTWNLGGLDFSGGRIP
jgi:hypothetical protein